MGMGLGLSCCSAALSALGPAAAIDKAIAAIIIFTCFMVSSGGRMSGRAGLATRHMVTQRGPAGKVYTIVGFQHEHGARAFLDDLKERMRKFELALHPDKTRLIRFGRHAARQREKLGEGKPDTFDFLGFTHFCTRSRKWGSFVIGRKTIKKRMRAKLLAIKIELRRKMPDPIAKTGAWVKQMLKGHLNYFAVSGNHPSLWWFFNKVKRLWLAALKRRSQTARLS